MTCTLKRKDVNLKNNMTFVIFTPSLYNLGTWNFTNIKLILLLW